MTDERIPYEPAPERVVTDIRDAIERNKRRQNERDALRQPKPDPEAA